MGFICLYVLIQKSGQKTAKSHLCAMSENFFIHQSKRKSEHLHINLIFWKGNVNFEICQFCEDKVAIIVVSVIGNISSLKFYERHGILIFSCLLFVLFEKITESWWKRKTWYFPQKQLNSKSWWFSAKTWLFSNFPLA